MQFEFLHVPRRLAMVCTCVDRRRLSPNCMGTATWKFAHHCLLFALSNMKSQPATLPSSLSFLLQPTPKTGVIFWWELHLQLLDDCGPAPEAVGRPRMEGPKQSQHVNQTNAACAGRGRPVVYANMPMTVLNVVMSEAGTCPALAEQNAFVLLQRPRCQEAK